MCQESECQVSCNTEGKFEIEMREKDIWVRRK